MTENAYAVVDQRVRLLFENGPLHPISIELTLIVQAIEPDECNVSVARKQLAQLHLHVAEITWLRFAGWLTDVIVQRWQQYTGKSATLESDGRSFAEITAERKIDAA